MKNIICSPEKHISGECRPKQLSAAFRKKSRHQRNLIRKLNFNLLMALVIRVDGLTSNLDKILSLYLLRRALEKAHRMLKSTIFAFYEDIPKDLYDIWKSQMSN